MRVKAAHPPAGRGARALAVRAVRGAHSGRFAVVMATGIVSAVLRQHGRLVSSAVLPAIADGCFAVLAAVSAWRAAAFPAELCGDLRSPGRAFTSFAFVAACDVLGDRLASDGQHDDAAAPV